MRIDVLSGIVVMYVPTNNSLVFQSRPCVDGLAYLPYEKICGSLCNVNNFPTLCGPFLVKTHQAKASALFGFGFLWQASSLPLVTPFWENNWAFF